MLNNNYKISIIVPAYNIAEYLPRCLDSILNQTYQHLEVILISDGSTDGTNDVIKKYAEKDNRIVAIFKENSGVSDTRNKGLDVATGDYIGFVDGDDYIEPDMYEILLRNAIENDAEISHCGYQMVFPSRVDYYYNTGRKVIQDNEKGVYDLITGRYIEPGMVMKLYKKDVLNGVRLPKGIKINEDVLFNIDAFINSKKSFYEDKPLYHYILRKGSAATSKINYNKIFDPLVVSKQIIDRCHSYGDIVKSAAIARFVGVIINQYRTVKINKLKSFYNEIEKYRAELKKISNSGLSRKLKIEKFLVSYIPLLYVLIYKIYDTFFSKSKGKYEVK